MELLFLCIDLLVYANGEVFSSSFKEIRVIKPEDVDEMLLENDGYYSAGGYNCIRYLESKEVKTWEEAAIIAEGMAERELYKENKRKDKRKNVY